MPTYTVNWSTKPQNCNVMFKLLKKCSENQKKCFVYDKMLRQCKKNAEIKQNCGLKKKNINMPTEK
jgi:hypothetical protein